MLDCVWVNVTLNLILSLYIQKIIFEDITMAHFDVIVFNISLNN